MIICTHINREFLFFKVNEDEIKTPPETPTPIRICDVCPSVVLKAQSECPKCLPGQLSDGKSCIPKNNCTCINDDIKYPVGASFLLKDCKKCTCTEGGVQKCEDFECKRCKNPNEYGVRIDGCNCICKPCPPGSRICPSSGVCVSEEKWCDGTIDCSDDEINCLPPCA